MLKRLLLLICIGCLLVSGVSVLAQANDTMDGRLQQAVIDNGIVLSSDQRLSLIAHCQNAQAILGRIQQNTDSLIEERDVIYTTIQQELQAIKLRMNRQGADASETDLLTGRIQQGLDDFDSLAADYKIALADVVSVNCVQQPEYFQAGLIMMRLNRAVLLDVLTQLKTAVSDPELYEQLKNRLVI